MPKKQCKNAFYYFMMDFKEEQRKKGIFYENLYELSVVVDPLWRNAPPAVREKYKEIAKIEKEKRNVSTVKVTNTEPVPLAYTEAEKKEQEKAEEAESKDIQNLVHEKSFHGTTPIGNIHVMDVNYYCQVNSDYLIAECTILRFNLNVGISEAYHEIINPGYTPLGFASNVKNACLEFGLQPPVENSKPTDYRRILSNIRGYLKQNNKDSKTLPPIFLMPEKLMPVQNFIKQLCNRAREDDSLFKLYKIDTLYFKLMNSIRTHDKGGISTESLALEQLKKDLCKFSPGLGCAHHEKTNKPFHCSMARAKRLAFTILDSCCPMVGVKMEPGKHSPLSHSKPDVPKYRQLAKPKPVPAVSSLWDMTPYSTSTLAASFGNTLTFTSPNYSRMNREYRTPQMPRADYSQIFRTAPDLSEANFPQLGASQRRGRGSVHSLIRFSTDK